MKFGCKNNIANKMKIPEVPKKLKMPITAKAKLFLDSNPTPNEAFDKAKWEDRQTIACIFNEGVDINYDVDKPNKLNMFNWSITAHGACDPYFLELMFKHGRSDIPTDGQKVFEAACEWGDSRHIEVFMKYDTKYRWNLFEGIKKSIRQDNVVNLHHLLMYHARITEEERLEMWNLATGNFIHGTRTLVYMVGFYGCNVSKETLMGSILNHFGDTLGIIIYVYLKTDKPFKITSDIVEIVLRRTHDRLYKLALLNGYGFEVEGYEKIKAEGEANLPKPEMTMYYTMAV